MRLAISLAAASAGALAALALVQTACSLPRVFQWLRAPLRALVRTGREGYAPSRTEQRRIAVLGSCVLLVLVLLAAGFGPLIMLAAAGPALATYVVAARRRRYRRRVEEGLGSLASALADGLTGGRSIRAVVASASESLEGPAQVEMRRVQADLDSGSSLEEALDALSGRVRSPRFDGLAAALITGARSGGEVAPLLTRMSAAAWEREEALADARATTVQARYTGLLVVSLPAGACVFAELMHPGFVSGMFDEPVASVLLVLAGLLQVLGLALTRRLGPRVD